MTMTGKPEVFARKASGLARVMSPWSAFMYNFLTMGVIFPWVFVWGPQAFPGTSVWMACLLAIVLQLPIALVYVWMTTAMPRSGGDYVFQSRVLGGAIGYPIVMSGLCIWLCQWFAMGGWFVANLALSPLFLGLGVHYQSNGLISAAVWVQSTEGVVVVSIIALAGMALLLITGFKNYVRLQYFMFAGTVIIIVVMLAQFLRTSPAEFAAAINKFSAFVDNNPDYYKWLQNDVSSTGFNLKPALSLAAVLFTVPIVWSSLQVGTWSVENGGEIKDARVFKSQLFILPGAMIAVAITLAIISWAEQRAVGTTFFNAASASYYGGVSQSDKGIGSIFPFPGVYAIVISPNPIITVLVFFGFLMASLQILCNLYIGCTRIIVGMSLDRLLPAWVSRVNSRFRSPVNAHLVYLVIAILVTFGYNYFSWWYSMTLGVTFASGYVYSISCLAAALLPYRAKPLYEASPGAKYTLAGIPWVTILGVIGFLFGLAAEIAFLAKTGYGLRGTTPYIVVAGVFLVALIAYWIGRQYQKSKGIDVSYAFLEVPPE